LNLAQFLEQRNHNKALEPKFRNICYSCWQPDFSCYCSWLKPFDPVIEFVILIHPIEIRKRIATGRMTHLSLTTSQLIDGLDYSQNAKVNALLKDPRKQCFMLYPGRTAKNLTTMSPTERYDLVDTDRTPVVFVIDGTWSTARTMVRLSTNLQTIPRVCFTPPAPSNFLLRKQPKPECVCTLEAIHQTIELLGPASGFSTATREHDSLLEVFEKMVRLQFDLTHNASNAPRKRTYRQA
jgi:DTW domain-containing protein